MKKKGSAVVLTAAVLATIELAGLQGLSGSARADDAQTAIDTRRATMKEIGSEMKAMYAVVDANSGDLADMEKRAQVVQADAAKIPTLFPAGTSIADMPDKTHALPAIWQNMDAFKAAASNLETQAGKLADAAKSGNMSAFAAQFETTGKACGNCHTDFRAKLN